MTRKFKDWPPATNNRCFITPQIWDELERYHDHGIQPSNFIMQVLYNNLVGAANGADAVNQAILGYVAKFVDRSIPPRAKGSPDRVMNWMKHQGTDGLPEEEGREIWST